MSAPSSQAPLIASLAWYDHPASAARLDSFWAALAGALRAAGHAGIPDALCRSTDPAAQWLDPRLLLSQCCGPDLFTAAGAALEVVARPAFAALDAAPGEYFSFVVAARGELDRPRVVINGRSSRSGCGSLAEWLHREGIVPETVVESGSHAASLEALRSGRADLAAIDAHAWRWLDVAGIAVLDRTRPAPSPPWVTRRGGAVSVAALRRSLERAVAERGAGIGLAGVVPARREDYETVAPDAILSGLGSHST